jgi:hypothetical protein
VDALADSVATLDRPPRSMSRSTVSTIPPPEPSPTTSLGYCPTVAAAAGG